MLNFRNKNIKDKIILLIMIALLILTFYGFVSPLFSIGKRLNLHFSGKVTSATITGYGSSRHVYGVNSGALRKRTYTGNIITFEFSTDTDTYSAQGEIDNKYVNLGDTVDIIYLEKKPYIYEVIESETSIKWALYFNLSKGKELWGQMIWTFIVFSLILFSIIFYYVDEKKKRINKS